MGPNSEATMARELPLRSICVVGDDPHPATATCLLPPCAAGKESISGCLGWRNRPTRRASPGENGGRENRFGRPVVMGMETEVFLRSVRGRLTERMYHVFVGRPASAEVSATPSRTRLPGTDGRLFQVGRRITSLVLWFDPCICYSKWEIVSFIVRDKG